MGLSPQAKPCETMPQLLGEFPSFPTSPLGQPTAWRLEGSFCSPKSRHHPLLTQFSFLGDTTQRDPSAQPSRLAATACMGPPMAPYRTGQALQLREQIPGGPRQEAPQRWLGQDPDGVCMGRGGQSTQATGFQLRSKGPRALALHPCWVSQQA